MQATGNKLVTYELQEKGEKNVRVACPTECFTYSEPQN